MEHRTVVSQVNKCLVEEGKSVRFKTEALPYNTRLCQPAEILAAAVCVPVISGEGREERSKSLWAEVAKAVNQAGFNCCKELHVTAAQLREAEQGAGEAAG